MKEAVYALLRHLGIPVSKSYLERLISSHADFPSILSVVDALERLGIRCSVLRMERDQLRNLAFPYILQVGTNHGTLLPIKNADDLNSREKDIQNWKGIVLRIEPALSVADHENNRIYRKEKSNTALKGALIGAGSIVLFWPLTASVSTMTIATYVTSVLGVVVGYILVAKETGTKFRVIETFCTSDANNNCDTLLGSDHTKLFGDITLSDGVFIYFSFQTICLSVSATFPPIAATIAFSLAVLSILLVPVLFYSIYYQHVKAKAWCRLCLIVDSILIIQAALIGYSTFSNAAFELSLLSGNIILLQAFIFVIVGSLTLLIKSKTEELSELKKSLSGAMRIKNSVEVFGALLERQPNDNGPTFLANEMAIGNRNAPVQLIVVNNLYCNPCKEQHKAIGSLIKAYPEKVRITFRFVESKDSESNQYLIQYWMQYIHNTTEEPIKTFILLHDWFKSMNLERFKKKYPIKTASKLEMSKELVANHRQWIEQMSITYTPTFFINGYRFPRGYDIGDMSALIPELANASKNASQTPQANLISS